jgi:hypothetical protein
MPDGNEIPQPTELIYLPRPSWAPAFFALGALLLVNGIFGEGFLFRGWVYMAAGAVVALAALRSMVAGAVREFFERPRRQRPHAAVLPAGSLKPPPKRG